MRIPRVNPVGIVEYPPAYAAAPRAYAAGIRLAAAVIAGAFMAVSVGTTVYSLGIYCLTSYADIPFPLAP
jgi:hypothetical protein